MNVMCVRNGDGDGCRHRGHIILLTFQGSAFVYHFHIYFIPRERYEQKLMSFAANQEGKPSFCVFITSVHCGSAVGAVKSTPDAIRYQRVGNLGTELSN